MYKFINTQMVVIDTNGYWGNVLYNLTENFIKLSHSRFLIVSVKNFLIISLKFQIKEAEKILLKL